MLLKGKGVERFKYNLEHPTPVSAGHRLRTINVTNYNVNNVMRNLYKLAATGISGF